MIVDLFRRLNSPRAALLAGAVFSLACVTPAAGAGPLCLHPENPHYFLFRGRPAFVVTSGEHYGAVLNLDFDYAKYLHALARDGMNGTRLWVGAYCEPVGAFKITGNTLAPAPGRFLSPWVRSDVPGYANGGNKFALGQWNPDYFTRLHDFVAQAADYGIIVEVNLFCPFYDESMWRLSPMNPANNINRVPPVASTNVYTVNRSGGLLARQEALVRKIAVELSGFDNVYYEICNEPYFGGVTADWQRRIAAVLADTEARLGTRHLISQNIANHKARVTDPNPDVSILNFHYASPPDTVAMNYGLDRLIGENETGFQGTADATYRMEAWDFMVAGGGLFNHLDYSFTAGHEEGDFSYPADQPGGGSPALRHQLAILADTLRGFDFVHMAPAPGAAAVIPSNLTVRTLARTGEDYLVYVRTAPGARRAGPAAFVPGQLCVSLKLPAGQYEAEWLNPRSGAGAGADRITVAGPAQNFSAPAFEDDIVLTVHRTVGRSTPAAPVARVPRTEAGAGPVAGTTGHPYIVSPANLEPAAAPATLAPARTGATIAPAEGAFSAVPASSQVPAPILKASRDRLVDGQTTARGVMVLDTDEKRPAGAAPTAPGWNHPAPARHPVTPVKPAPSVGFPGAYKSPVISTNIVPPPGFGAFPDR